MSTQRIQSVEPNLELLRLLEESKRVVDNMTPEQKKEMLEAQRQSWTRQDMD